MISLYHENWQYLSHLYSRAIKSSWSQYLSFFVLLLRSPLFHYIQLDFTFRCNLLYNLVNLIADDIFHFLSFVSNFFNKLHLDYFECVNEWMNRIFFSEYLCQVLKSKSMKIYSLLYYIFSCWWVMGEWRSVFIHWREDLRSDWKQGDLSNHINPNVYRYVQSTEF